MTRRGARHRRGPAGTAAVALLLLLGSSATVTSAALLSPRPTLRDPVRLAQGTKAPVADSAEDAAASGPPAALPPGASLGMAQASTSSAALTFSSAPMSFPAAPVTAPQESAAAPSTAPAVGVPLGTRNRGGSAEADAGPPDAVPPGARFGTAQTAFTSAEMRFADAHVVAVSSRFAAPGAAALPGGVELREEGRGLRVTLDADVLFDFDRAELRRDAGPRLQRLMQEVSARVPRPAFRVEGHTDWIGGDAYNLRLSTRRAEAVRNWLVREAGVPRPAVSTVGHGESRPVAPNAAPDGRDDPDGRQRNRRVELLVTPR